MLGLIGFLESNGDPLPMSGANSTGAQLQALVRAPGRVSSDDGWDGWAVGTLLLGKDMQFYEKSKEPHSVSLYSFTRCTARFKRMQEFHVCST